MNTALNKPNPYDYSDFREFLRDFYLYEKSKNPRFSGRMFSKRANLRSPSYLYTLINGKRNASPITINKIARAIGLNSSEHFRFERLVLWNQARSKTDMEFYKETMPKLVTVKESRWEVSAHQMRGTQ